MQQSHEGVGIPDAHFFAIFSLRLPSSHLSSFGGKMALLPPGSQKERGKTRKEKTSFPRDFEMISAELVDPALSRGLQPHVP